MKINVNDSDYRCEGMGYNSWNLVKNVCPRINKWLFMNFEKSKFDDYEEVKKFAKKLILISEIIDKEENE